MKFLEPWVLILILIIVLILFGPKRLPDLGKSMRKGMRAFKEEVTPEDDESPKEESDSVKSAETDSEQPSGKGGSRGA